MKTQDHNTQTANAAGRQGQRILSKALAPSTKAFFQKITLKKAYMGWI